MSAKNKEENEQTDQRGIEYLNKLDHLFIKQYLEIIEILTCIHTPNKYAIRNHEHKTIYCAIEKSKRSERFYLGRRRCFELTLVDVASEKKLCRMVRSLKCASCRCYTHSQEITVYLYGEVDPIGNVLHEDKTLGSNILSINNAKGDNILMIRGPKRRCCFSQADYVFNLHNKNSADISLGTIKKHWAGWGQEILTNADNFSIVFPLNTDLNTKLLILSAAFLIDFIFFE